MPTYVYACNSCDQTFEVEQRITEDPLQDCQCGSKGTVKRVIQPVGIAFKGSGFYVTDYAGSGSAGSSGASASTAPATPSAPAACTSDKGSCGCSN